MPPQYGKNTLKHKEKGGETMFDRRFLMLAVGGVALGAVVLVGAGLMVRRKANKLRANMRSVSRGVYNFGTALQLLSGADAEDACESGTCC
jgi:hypothetical protein